MVEPQWQIYSVFDIPASFLQAVQQQSDRLLGQKQTGTYAAQLLWQRHIRDLAQLPGFLNPDLYQPASPFEFGDEMQWAVKRLVQAQQEGESIAIWGDFDADGITATAVLWDGLGQFFPQQKQLTYFIPNRLTESHGLSIAGLDRLAAQNCSLIVTCDTGSTSLRELEYAQELGIDVIITDHHTLPPDRPPVIALINPRTLPAEHPLAHLSGVAVAYKLVEALYSTLPEVPDRPLESLLDLVAIGLIADLVNLTGDCRYLAQRGIERLQHNQTLNPPPRPGIAKLLELCKRTGDRPTDISFGIGPRINAISRIHGDAHFCVELLTSQDADRCRKLAEDTELANARRKALQRDVVQQVKTQLAQQDLSTTHAIVLSDPQWSIGILGLVAGQIAQEYGRPTILLTTDTPLDSSSLFPPTPLPTPHSPLPPPLARGSARSVNSIDLYQLVEQQAHLLHHFGGHPLAMGLSLPVENIPLFREAIDRQLREQESSLGIAVGAVLQADLTVTVAELGKELFRELKLLEPYGMGNPVPKLLVQNCWFRNAENRNIKDWKGRKIRYIKTEFELWDESVRQGFPGIWWEHYRDEVPPGRCDAIVELDFNTYKKRYEVRLMALRSAAERSVSVSPSADWLLDWRGKEKIEETGENVLLVTRCPGSWSDLQAWVRQVKPGQHLALAYPPPSPESPAEIWQRLVGMAKYLSRTGKQATQTQLQEKLGIGDRSLQFGFQALQQFGFQITASETGFSVSRQAIAPFSQDELSPPNEQPEEVVHEAIVQFLNGVKEEQFQQRYFYEVPIAILRAVMVKG
jgi:single-stranded-DNA-specific exonuclease